jgi:uncharacterized protein (DUF488 family)
MAPSPNNGTRTIYSIGHSNLSIQAFISLLCQNRVEAIVDTRSYPYSKHVPHFNERALSSAVRAAGIKYVFMGEELGGRPKDKRFYDSDGRVLYGLVAKTKPFQEAIERIQQGSEKYRLALLCSEDDPTFCHRNLLIGRVLRTRGFDILHIRKNGILENDAEVVQRNASQFRMFRDSEAEWKSIQSVLQRKAQSNSLKRFGGSKFSSS